MIANFITFVFEQKLDVDDRAPLLSWDLGGDTWGLYPPSICYWAQALVVRRNRVKLIDWLLFL